MGFFTRFRTPDKSVTWCSTKNQVGSDEKQSQRFFYFLQPFQLITSVLHYRPAGLGVARLLKEIFQYRRQPGDWIPC